MVRFLELETKQAVERLSSVAVKGSEIVSQISQSNDYEVRFAPSTKPDLTLSYNLKDFIHPLGRAGRVMYEEKNYDALKNFLATYWSYKGEPQVEFDVIKGVGDEGFDCLTLRNRVTREGDAHMTLQDFLGKVPMDKVKDKLNRLVISGDGDHIEMQFLATENRKEVKAGDFIDPGVFVRLNGKVEVSPGLNRLVCTNGLVDRMNIWEAQEFDFLTDRDMFQRALGLADWLISKAGQRVNSVREISAAFGDSYRKGLLNRYWKSWSEKIELKELMWYDVIADLTSFANRSLSNERYKLLEVPTLITRFETKGCCPTCSSAVK